MENKLAPIFNEIKKVMKRYEPPLVAKSDFDYRYDLWSKQEVVIAGRKRNEVAFAAIIIQSHYVGFYFMPIYTDAPLSKVFKPELLSKLKGKSCFHIKEYDREIFKQIGEALETGFRLYKKRGWV